MSEQLRKLTDEDLKSPAQRLIDDLERQLTEAQGTLGAIQERQRTWTTWGQMTPKDDKHAAYLDAVAELAADLGAILSKEGNDNG